MNRWFGINALAIAIFAVRGYFFPANRWWAMWGIALVIGGVCLHFYETAMDKRAEQAMEENNDCKVFYLTITGVFLAGTVLALCHHTGLWSLAFGGGSLLVYFMAFLMAVAGGEKLESPAN